uniref:Uncharacterized protein n=1 Tax=Parascaris equorum TaxID=6256 RepID=A0A914RT79_PAREQ
MVRIFPRVEYKPTAVFRWLRDTAEEESGVFCG